jgi:hypothetical protein
MRLRMDQLELPRYSGSSGCSPAWRAAVAKVKEARKGGAGCAFFGLAMSSAARTAVVAELVARGDFMRQHAGRCARRAAGDELKWAKATTARAEAARYICASICSSTRAAFVLHFRRSRIDNFTTY